LLVLQAAPVEADLRGITVGAAAESLVHESVMLRVREHGPEPVDAFTESRYWKRVAVERLRAHPALAIKHFLMGVGFSFVNVGTAGLADILRFHSSGQTVVVHEARSFAGLAHAWITRKSPAQISVGLGIGAYLACVYVLAMFGAWLLFRAGRLGRWECFCMLMVAYFVLVAGAAGEARFRLPAVPFYVGFVGVGIVAIVDIAWGRRER
jgi:hypothetical protein